MTSAMSIDSEYAAGLAVWERDGKQCVRCNHELPDFRDSRTDAIRTLTAGEADHENLRTLCVACYVLRGTARRWRTANIGMMISTGVLPANWRELIWFEDESREPSKDVNAPARP